MSEITTEARHPYVSAGNVKTISREELREKLERGDRFKLVMTLGEWAYRSKHISGSLNLYAPEQIPALLDPDDEIVVYCSNPSCWASIKAYYFLQSRGYKNVRRYAGGIADWEEAGYPLEGEMVQSPSAIWP